MKIPEYSVSLLIWIIPIVVLSVFFKNRHLLSRGKTLSMVITIGIFSAIGAILDLFLGDFFFVFPNPDALIGIRLNKIPIEEFVFYIAGLWFILFLYVFCDEWFLKKYNPPDEKYARFRFRIKRLLFIHFPSCRYALAALLLGAICKKAINPECGFIPGYFFFLVIVIGVPAFLFYRVTKSFVNWRAFQFVLILTVLISVIWEVTLALPRGYWGYQKQAMLGIFIDVWHGLPIEAVFVWISGTIIIVCYEFLKICFFTEVPPSKTR
jgi:lycopene cyclase domain-containing protein